MSSMQGGAGYLQRGAAGSGAHLRCPHRQGSCLACLLVRLNVQESFPASELLDDCGNIRQHRAAKGQGHEEVLRYVEKWAFYDDREALPMGLR